MTSLCMLYHLKADGFKTRQICMIHKLGYGNWDELKAAFRTSPLFRFDWFVKSRTTQELARRCDTLIRLVERENQEYDERERQARKEKKLAKVCIVFGSELYAMAVFVITDLKLVL